MKQIGIICVFLVVLVACSGKSAGKPEKMTERETVNLQLGVRYLQQKDYRSAIDKLNKVLETSPKLVVGHSMLGLAYSELDDYVSAERHFAIALQSANKKHKEFAEVNNSYGIFKCRQKEFVAAQAAFKQAYEHKAYSNVARAYENAALCAQDEGDPVNAERLFKLALTKQPKMSRSLLAMAKIKIEAGQSLLGRAYVQRYEHSVIKPSAEGLWLGYKVEKQLKDEKRAGLYKAQLRSEYPGSEYLTQLDMQ